MTERLTLISHKLCPYVQRAAIVLAEKGIAFERVDVDLSNKPDWFLRISPLGKTPVLLVDEEPIFESAVICEYLDDLGGGSLFPKAGADKWQALRWHAFGDGLLDALILWRNERERSAPLAALLAAFELKTTASLSQLDDEARIVTFANGNGARASGRLRRGAADGHGHRHHRRR